MAVADRVSSYVALGDSFTEGLEDEVGSDGRHRGWADRLAAALAVRNGRLNYANLAVRGRLLDAVVSEQLSAGLLLAPSLISFHAGVNDVLHLRAGLPGLLDRYEDAVGRLRAGGREVLLFTSVGRTGGSGRTADLLAGRCLAFNRRIRRVAAQQGCLLVDLGAVPALQDRRLWHEDRLHLSPAGHARVAAAALEELGVADPRLLGGPVGWWRRPLPSRADTGLAGRGADLVADAVWLRRHLLPWVGRRLRGVSSGDLVVAKQAELLELRAPAS